MLQYIAPRFTKLSYSPQQVAPGEELESDRYLITIEERLSQPSSDHRQETSSKTAQHKETRSSGFLYQPGKRKRKVRNVLVPLVNYLNPILLNY